MVEHASQRFMSKDPFGLDLCLHAQIYLDALQATRLAWALHWLSYAFRQCAYLTLQGWRRYDADSAGRKQQYVLLGHRLLNTARAPLSRVHRVIWLSVRTLIMWFDDLTPDIDWCPKHHALSHCCTNTIAEFTLNLPLSVGRILCKSIGIFHSFWVQK